MCRMFLLVLLFYENRLILINGEKFPDSVTSLQAFQLSPTVVYVKWDKPVNNHILTNCDIQYSEILDGFVGDEEYLVSVNANATQVKLPSLKTLTNNRIYVYAIYTNIASNPTTIDVTLKNIGKYQPVQPTFTYELGKSKQQILITWTPNGEHAGDTFFVNYRKKGEPQFVKTDKNYYSFDIIINPLELGQIYQFYIVTSYDKSEAVSEIIEILT